MGEGDGQADLAEEKAEGELRRFVAVLQLPLEQAERDQHHQRPDTARRPPGPRDDAGREERPCDGDARERVRHGRVEVVP